MLMYVYISYPYQSMEGVRNIDNTDRITTECNYKV